MADHQQVQRRLATVLADDGGICLSGEAHALVQPKRPNIEKPAIAVLPFDNMSGDPDQEYLADGLTEDIITALSLWRSFPVIARNSTFAYMILGTALDNEHILDGVRNIDFS